MNRDYIRVEPKRIEPPIYPCEGYGIPFAYRSFVGILVYLVIKYVDLWARSSVGRALPWHGRGKGFDPPRVHNIKRECFLNN
jgi:hypothetical protein